MEIARGSEVSPLLGRLAVHGRTILVVFGVVLLQNLSNGGNSWWAFVGVLSIVVGLTKPRDRSAERIDALVEFLELTQRGEFEEVVSKVKSTSARGNSKMKPMVELRTRRMATSLIDEEVQALREGGYAIYMIDTPLNAHDFIAQAMKSFPLNPELSGQVNWAAFKDSLSSGLFDCGEELGESRIALVIRDASTFRANDQQQYEWAIGDMECAAGEVTRQMPEIYEKEITVKILIGTG